MSEASGPACPHCGRADTVGRVADLPTDGPIRVSSPPPPTVPATPFGCLSVGLVSLAAVTAAIAIGGLAELNAGPISAPAGDLRVGDTAVFTGILAFMLVFVGLFSILVWRQVRGDARLRERVAEWRTAVARREVLLHCTHCGVVFDPERARTVPADQAELLLYE